MPLVLDLSAGGRVLEDDGRLYSLYSYIQGSHVDASVINFAQATKLGATLARIHVALADYPCGPVAEDGAGNASIALQRIPDLVAAIGEHPDADERSRAVASLRSRAVWLEHHLDSAPACPDDVQLIHGDYQLTNVLFSGDDIAGVIDWDKARAASPAVEVVRAMHHGLGMEPVACAAFLDGYRSARSMERTALDEAARWFETQQATSLWVFEEIYMRANDRVRRFFFEPAVFEPFSTSWERLRVT